MFAGLKLPISGPISDSSPIWPNRTHFVGIPLAKVNLESGPAPAAMAELGARDGRSSRVRVRILAPTLGLAAGKVSAGQQFARRRRRRQTSSSSGSTDAEQ